MRETDCFWKWRCKDEEKDDRWTPTRRWCDIGFGIRPDQFTGKIPSTRQTDIRRKEHNEQQQ